MCGKINDNDFHETIVTNYIDSVYCHFLFLKMGVQSHSIQILSHFFVSDRLNLRFFYGKMQMYLRINRPLVS